jgi:group II intron reverse transcriptase/maturase
MPTPTALLDRVASRANLHAAFERVHDNAGCRGADGMTVGDFARNLESEIDRLQNRLLSRRYHPFPLLRFTIPKTSSGLRRLCVPTVRDRVVQTAVDLVTRDRFEAELADVSYAYRRGRSVRSAIHRVNELRDLGFRFLVDADIDDFFDSVPHDQLLARLGRLNLDPYVLALFESWIRVDVYDGERVFRMEKGVPQGSVVSPMLANLFLDELDDNLALFGQAVVRYADDFLVLCKSPAAAEEALELTDYLVAQLELHLDREKTHTASFDQGFTFLGAIFLKDTVYLPFEPHPASHTAQAAPALPPPLDLWTYLELRLEVRSERQE